MADITAVRRLGSHKSPKVSAISRQGMSCARRLAGASGSTRYAANTSVKRGRSRSLWTPATANRSAMPMTIKYPNAGSSKGAALGSDQYGRRRADVFDGSQQFAAGAIVNVQIRTIYEDAVEQRLRVARKLDRARRILECDLLHALLACHIVHPDVLSRVLVGRQGTSMHDGVQPRQSGVHRELLHAAGTPPRLALRFGGQPPGVTQLRVLGIGLDRIYAAVERHEVPSVADPHSFFSDGVGGHIEQRLGALLTCGAVVAQIHQQQRTVAAYREERARPGRICQRASR